jgi:hypothetical protein
MCPTAKVMHLSGIRNRLGTSVDCFWGGDFFASFLTALMASVNASSVSHGIKSTKVLRFLKDELTH